jgi:hypothetical protein
LAAVSDIEIDQPSTMRAWVIERAGGPEAFELVRTIRSAASDAVASCA